MDTLLFEKRDGTALLTLNRPEHHNAFNLGMMNELDTVWAEIKADDDIVAVVVTASGDKAFCTGMDLSDLNAGEAEAIGDLPMEESPVFKLTAIQQRCWKPVITAVNGMVCGGGLHFVADSDLVLAAEHASFFDTHVKVGLVAGLEPVGLARRLPLEAVLRMALLGGSERLSAEEAKSLGLVGEILPAEALLPRAIELAERIAKHSPAALMRTKKAIWDSLDTGLHQALSNTWDSILAHNAHPDLAEGTRAFVERRAPVWSKAPDLNEEA
jgi:enoyl-CoA hydratase/carnithine racemase